MLVRFSYFVEKSMLHGRHSTDVNGTLVVSLMQAVGHCWLSLCPTVEQIWPGNSGWATQ